MIHNDALLWSNDGKKPIIFNLLMKINLRQKHLKSLNKSEDSIKYIYINGEDLDRGIILDTKKILQVTYPSHERLS